MARETDLLFAVLGLQMNFLTKDRILECAALWASNSEKTLKTILEEKGYLKPSARTALEALVKAQIEEFGSAEKSLAALPADEDVRRALGSFFPGASRSSTILRWSAEEPRSPRAGIAGELDAAFAHGAETVDDSTPCATGSATAISTLRRGAEGKYEFRGELGRGGLGRVVEAVDHDFGREVAIKMMLPGPAEGSFVERFLLEARAAGRLSHPNIVPVHEIGVLKQGQGEAPYFTMTKVAGRDLGRILRDIEAGDDATRKRFSRHRLLAVFQDVCNAIFYAHDHGVIHRDLKPSNVMVGMYGEVYVVDWGLAKVKGQTEAPGGITRILARSPVETPQLTLEGQVLGTPAYMPPEQAEGRIAEIDEQSDIYSLGAILYEILTLRPPFEGESALEVIAKVIEGTVTPPSSRLTTLREAKAAHGEKEPLDLESVPVELDEVVIRALSKHKSDRYASARDLHEEIQRFLEGEKQREYNRERALAKVAEGRILAQRMEKARAEMKALEREAREKSRELKPFWPIDKKADAWAAQNEVRNRGRLIIDLFTEAGSAFQAALEFERGNKEARAALADLHWAQFLIEEERGDEAEMRRNEKLVRQYNDGQYDARLKGDGALAIATRSYPCRCLTEGRMVSPEELGCSAGCEVSCVENGSAPSGRSSPDAPRSRHVGVMGYHPFSGRSLDGRKGAEGLPELEPREPFRLKVHGAECKTEPLAGADVWLFRFEERDRVLVPVFPEGVISGQRSAVSGERKEDAAGHSPQDAGVTAYRLPLTAVLDRLYDPGSPFRPKEGLYLGKTPVARFFLPMGSYLVIIAKEGFHPVRFPVDISRLAEEEMEVTLYWNGEIPAGFIQVPAGRCIFQGDKENPQSGQKEIKDIEDVFIAKFPTTCLQYLEFLNDMAAEAPDDAAKRAPRKAPTAGVYWPFIPCQPDGLSGRTDQPDRIRKGKYVIPTQKWVAGATEDSKKKASKLDMSPGWWEEDWPVFGVSWLDMIAYAAWKTRKEGMLFSLPHEIQWEKSARGTAGRYYPWGSEFDATFCNMNQSRESGMRPAPVDSFPIDESPYGVRGLGGNARDLCLNDAGEGYPDWRVCHGGSWTDAGIYIRCVSRMGDTIDDVQCNNGARLSWLPRC